jgi:hypothetical protein
MERRLVTELACVHTQVPSERTVRFGSRNSICYKARIFVQIDSQERGSDLTLIFQLENLAENQFFLQTNMQIKEQAGVSNNDQFNRGPTRTKSSDHLSMHINIMLSFLTELRS